MNFIVIPTLPFSPLVLEANGYSSSDSFSTSSKKSLSVHAEVESSDTVIMLVMMTEAVNFEEQLASMKATLDLPSKESAEKNTQIKSQNEQIVELRKKLKRISSEASNKDLSDEDSDKESNRNKESGDISIRKKESNLLKYQYKNSICFSIF